jgi:hypothetical protein
MLTLLNAADVRKETCFSLDRRMLDAGNRVDWPFLYTPETLLM